MLILHTREGAFPIIRVVLLCLMVPQLHAAGPNNLDPLSGFRNPLGRGAGDADMKTILDARFGDNATYRECQQLLNSTLYSFR